MIPREASPVALAHHWLVTWRGGEHVLAAIAELWPDADLFTLVCDRRAMRARLPGMQIHASLLQSLPRAARWYRYYLPLFPVATRALDATRHPLVISSDAALVKGLKVDPDALHICYCHTPMRYVWSGYEFYCQTSGRLGRRLLPAVAPGLRRYDAAAAGRVSAFVANSHAVAARIRRYYGRDSTVIHPPVDVDVFVSDPRQQRGNEYLVVSPLVPYKRVDLAVEAFNRSGLPLCIVGEGSQRTALERVAGSNIRFLGAQPRPTLIRLMQRSRALIFPGEEDFGIVMAEALACGCPVVAYARGGAAEIVKPDLTGVLFPTQSAEGLADGLERLQRMTFDGDLLRASVLRFSRARFQAEFSKFVATAWAAHGSSHVQLQAAAVGA